MIKRFGILDPKRNDSWIIGDGRAQKSSVLDVTSRDRISARFSKTYQTGYRSANRLFLFSLYVLFLSRLSFLQLSCLRFGKNKSWPYRLWGQHPGSVVTAGSSCFVSSEFFEASEFLAQTVQDYSKIILLKERILS